MANEQQQPPQQQPPQSWVERIIGVVAMFALCGTLFYLKCGQYAFSP